MIIQVLVCLLIYIISLQFVYHKGKTFYKDQGHVRLYDISHQYLPNFFHLKPMKDFWLLLLLIPFLNFSGDKFGLIREIIGYVIVLTIIRAGATALTIAPMTDSRCDSENRINWAGSCYDLALSGHTAFGLIVSLVFLETGLINYTFLILFNVINILLILSTRSHYAIDCLTAVVVTLLVFQNGIKV